MQLNNLILRHKKKRKFLKYSLFFTFLILGIFSQAYGYNLPAGFVYLHHIDPTIKQNIEFATSKNFVGVPLKGYGGSQVICTHDAAIALSHAQTMLRRVLPGHSLIVEDAYRPVSAVKHIQRWANNTSNQQTKLSYFPYIDKRELLGPYISARRSAHSRGSTFDVFVVNEKTGKRLEYGPTSFGFNSNIHYKRLTIRQYYNRLVLRNLMINNGFKPYDREFWHFTLIKEPFPNTYFNFEIRNDRSK